MKRFITFILALILTITSLPVSVLAIDADTTPPTLTVTTLSETTEAAPVIVYDTTAFSNKATEATTTYTVEGTVSDNVAVNSVTVNGTEATLTDGSWTAAITLKANEVTPITVVATDNSGNTTTKTEYANYRIYQDSDDDPNTINFVNFEEDFNSKYKANNNTGSVEHTENHALSDVHKYSILWTGHPDGSTSTTDSRMRFFLASEDVGTITADGSLTMQIYSEKATGATMQVLLWCATNGVGGSTVNSVYRTNIDTGIKINWTGEKTIELDWADFAKSNSPSADKIYYIELAANKGFSSGASGSAETVLYIQDMYIKKDATAPSLTVTTPAGMTEEAPTIADSSTYTISGTATDAKGLTSVTVNGNNVTPDVDGAWSYDIALEANVVTAVTIVAENSVGNKVTETRYVKYSFTKDETAPELTITTPTGTTEAAPVIVYDATAFSNKVTEATTTYTVTGTVSDNVAVNSVTVNGTEAALTDGSWAAAITLKANEVTPITVVATDTSGNTTTKTEYANYRIYWDTDNNSNTINFVNFEENFSSKYKANNYTGTVEHTESHALGNHKYSIYWADHQSSAGENKDSRMRFFLAPEDVGSIKEDGSLVIKMYSEKATGATMQVLLWCASTGAGAEKNVVYRTDISSGIKINWTGEKTIELDWDDFATSNSPSLDKIYFVELAANKGFSSGASGSADTKLYIQDMYIKKENLDPILTVSTPNGTTSIAPCYTQDEAFTVEGTVSSKVGSIKTLTVNGTEATVEADGTWSAQVQVPTDGTVLPIEIVAIDNVGNSTTQTEYVCYGVQYTLDFINFEDPDIISRYKSTTYGTVEASTEHTTEDHTYSIRWYNHGTSSVSSEGNTRLKFALETGKMTTDSALKLKIYSEKANDARIRLNFYCPKASDGSLVLYYTWITVNWEGEKEVTVYFSSMDETNSPDWSEVYYAEFVASGGWSLAGKADTDLYISDAYIQLDLPRTDYLGTLEQLYEEADVVQTLELLKDSVAFYAGATNVAVDNGATDTALMGQKDLGGTVGYVNETVMIPIHVFEDYFDAAIAVDGSHFSITRGEKTFTGTVDQTTCNFANASNTLSVAPYVKENIIYVPGAEVAELFGISVCADGEFLLLGTEAGAAAVKRKGGIGVNIIQEIASYLSYYTEQDLGTFTDADFEEFLDNWARRLVGNEEINTSGNAYVQQLIAGNERNAENALNLFLGDERTSTSLFRGTEITTTTAMTQTYKYICQMALGYATYGSKYYQAEEVYEIIKDCLEWMTDNYYYVGYTWQPTGKNNWWDWGIGTPAQLLDTLIVMRDKFSLEEIQDYLGYFEAKYSKPQSTGANWANYSVQILCSGALQKDAERAMVGLSAFEKMYLYVDDNERITDSFLDNERAAYTQIKGAGFFTDGSYVYHTLHPMNHTYGADHFAKLCLMESVTAGTVFEINSPQRNNLVEFFFNNLHTTIYDGTKTFLMFMGRHTQNDELGNGTGVYGHMLECADNFSNEVSEKIYAAIKGAYEESPDSRWGDFLTFDTAEKFTALISNEAVEANAERNWNKVYYNQDTIVHLKEDWAVGIKMSSSRIFNYESINNENLEGWYLGDGRTEYFIKGIDIGSTSAYWAAIDKYRLPGTTVDTQERQAVSVDQGNEYLSSKDFVGGTTLNGIYGTAAMELESYHAEEPLDRNYDGKGANPAHTNDLTAKKGYFMFDNSIICLGTDVNASNNNDAEVLTIVENKMAKGIKNYGDGVLSVPYEIVGVKASAEPQEDNPASHTIDGFNTTKWAAQAEADIIWDLGEVKEMGFVGLTFLNGNVRQQYFDLYVSTNDTDNVDEIVWEKLNGDTRMESSGESSEMEYFDLQDKEARYLKFVHLGTSVTSTWISLAECEIYAPNEDGSIGVNATDIYGSDAVVVDGQVIELLGEDYNLNNATWANVADECGYIFFANDTSATSTLGDLKARWTNGTTSFFELWYSHGVNPDNGSYSYALLPGMTAEETAQYAENIPVQVLANNSAVQAVYNEELGITGIIFWEAGTFGKITVDKPCIVMYEDSHFGFNIAVTDPTQKLESLTVTIAEELNLVSADECATVLSTTALSEGTTTITLDTLDSVGRTFEVSLVKAGHSLTKTEAKAEDCTTDGNIAYWTCDTCGKFFADEKGITEITLADTVIEEKGHSYKDGVCEVCGAPDPDAEEDTGSDSEGVVCQKPEIIIEGTVTSYAKGSGGSVSIHCTGDHEKLLSVWLKDNLSDYREVDKSNYTVTEGSTIVTFKPEFVETLSESEYMVMLMYSDGNSVESKLTVQETVVDNTDDDDGTNDSVNNDTNDSEVAQAKVALSEAAPTGDNTSFIWVYILAASIGSIVLFFVYRKKHR